MKSAAGVKKGLGNQKTQFSVPDDENQVSFLNMNLFLNFQCGRKGFGKNNKIIGYL
jgi:hypothetical protein